MIYLFNFIYLFIFKHNKVHLVAEFIIQEIKTGKFVFLQAVIQEITILILERNTKYTIVSLTSKVSVSKFPRTLPFIPVSTVKQTIAPQKELIALSMRGKNVSGSQLLAYKLNNSSPHISRLIKILLQSTSLLWQCYVPWQLHLNFSL